MVNPKDEVHFEREKGHCGMKIKYTEVNEGFEIQYTLVNDLIDENAKLCSEHLSLVTKIKFDYVTQGENILAKFGGLR